MKQLSPASLILVILLFSIPTTATAQQNMITRYFDSLWQPIPKDSAFYYTEMQKEGEVYRYTSYWKKSGKLHARSTYTDTSFANPVGLFRKYYEAGTLEDSTFYHEKGQIKSTWHFYPNGKLYVHYTYDPSSKKEVTKAYDQNGVRIENFVFMREAFFPDNLEDWKEFLTDNTNTKVPIRNKAPDGTYQVIVRFVIEPNGKIKAVKAETNHGFGMEEEVIRVIRKSPRWSPAMYLGEYVHAYRRQPITFVVK